jgi:hypothetical protein
VPVFVTIGVTEHGMARQERARLVTRTSGCGSYFLRKRLESKS